MKKFLLSLLLITAVSMTALAGLVYDRQTNTVANATGLSTWTNTQAYAALELRQIWIANSAVAIDTVTVKRVSSDNVWTQNVVAIVLASNAGASNILAAAGGGSQAIYMKQSDKLSFTSTAKTGSVAMIEYIVEQH